MGRKAVEGKSGKTSGYRKAMYRNLVTDLLGYEKITTTEAKAKAVQPIAERLITLARRGDLHARRLAAREIQDPAVLSKLFDEIGPLMEDRPGGYTRIYKLGPRQGDAAKMAQIELIGVE